MKRARSQEYDFDLAFLVGHLVSVPRRLIQVKLLVLTTKCLDVLAFVLPIVHPLPLQLCCCHRSDGAVLMPRWIKN